MSMCQSTKGKVENKILYERRQKLQVWLSDDNDALFLPPFIM